RAVWNMTFIVALQLHRQNELTMRDQFIAALLDDTWFPNAKDRLCSRAARFDTDMSVICFFLFMYSNSQLKTRFHLHDPRLSLNPIEIGRDRIRPQRIRAAIDLVRKLRSQRVSAEQALRDYLAGDGTLGVYLGSFPDLIRGLADG